MPGDRVSPLRPISLRCRLDSGTKLIVALDNLTRAGIDNSVFTFI